MNKYIKQFNNHQLYALFTLSSDYIEPNVSLCIDENDLHYAPAEHNIIRYSASEEPTLYERGFGGANVVSHEFANGVGTITLDRNVLMLEYPFEDASNVTSITLPKLIKTLNLSGFSALETIEIPESVTSVTLQNCSSLKAVRLPKNTTQINSGCFLNCESLEYVNIPQGVTTIGDSAFYGCINLSRITLPNTLLTIGNMAFQDCSKLKEIEIPRSVLTIGNAAFLGVGITRAFVPNSVINYGSVMFNSCPNLEYLEIEGGNQNVGGTLALSCPKLKTVKLNIWYAHSGSFSNSTNIEEFSINGGYVYGPFNGSSNLKKVYVGSGVLYLGSLSFMNCTALEEACINSNAIDSSAFKGCTSLTNLELGDNLKQIGSNAFDGCTALATVILPAGLEKIDYYTFLGCTSILEINIPNGIKTIGDSAFKGCSALESIEINAETSYYYGSIFNGCTSLKHAVLRNGEFNQGCFTGCPLESVEILDKAKIYSNAFKNITTLTSVIFDTSNEDLIGSEAFCGCTGINSIGSIDEDVDFKIGKCRGFLNGVFSNIGTISYVNIPRNISYFSSNPFYNDTIEELRIPGDLLVSSGNGSIGYDLFGTGSTNPVYSKIYVYGNTIKPSLFSDASFKSTNYNSTSGKYESTIELADTITTIGSLAFYGCSGLKKIVIPDSVVDIKSSAFYNCYDLTEIILSKNVKNIGSRCFCNCSNLIRITIPDSVVEIGNNAFEYCSKLMAIKLGKNVKLIGENAFINGIWKKIEIPESVVNIGNSAFRNYKCETVICRVKEPLFTSLPFYNSSTCKIYVPAESVDVYKAKYTNFTDYIYSIDDLPTESGILQDAITKLDDLGYTKPINGFDENPRLVICGLSLENPDYAPVVICGNNSSTSPSLYPYVPANVGCVIYKEGTNEVYALAELDVNFDEGTIVDISKTVPFTVPGYIEGTYNTLIVTSITATDETIKELIGLRIMD